MQNDEQQIRGIMQMWLRATQDRNPDLILNSMANDMILLQVGDEIRGKKAYAETLNGLKGVDLKIKGEIQELVISGSLAYCWYTVDLEVKVAAHNIEIHRQGPSIAILRKSGNAWYITREASLLQKLE